MKVLPCLGPNRALPHLQGGTALFLSSRFYWFVKFQTRLLKTDFLETVSEECDFSDLLRRCPWNCVPHCSRNSVACVEAGTGVSIVPHCSPLALKALIVSVYQEQNNRHRNPAGKLWKTRTVWRLAVSSFSCVYSRRSFLSKYHSVLIFLVCSSTCCFCLDSVLCHAVKLAVVSLWMYIFVQTCDKNKIHHASPCQTSSSCHS